MPSRKAHTLVLLRSFASPPLRWFYKLSCDERPRGSLPAFAWDDIATPIHPITGWPSLSPRSYARTAMGKPCGLLSPKGAIRDFHVPLAKAYRVRHLLSAGRHVGHDRVLHKRKPRLLYPFGASVKAISACSESRPLTQIHICLPYRLSRTVPTHGCQKGMHLTIYTLHLAMLRYFVRFALDSEP
jgi:hypothetical protein